jgi:hypothetical protein
MNEQVAPIAPMLAGQVNTFDASAASASTAGAWTNGSVKQDGMFRNSTVNDFSSMTGVVNVNPLSSRTPQASRSTSGGFQQSPARAPTAEWALDPALMDPELEGPGPNLQEQPEDEDYADAQDALLAYYQSNGLPPVSSQESANQFMNGFVDYEAGQPKMEMEIDPMLEASFTQVQAPGEAKHAQSPFEDSMDVDGEAHQGDAPSINPDGVDQSLTNGINHLQERPLDPALDPSLGQSRQLNHDHDDHSNGLVLPSTEDTPLKRQSSREVRPIERFAPEPSSATPVKQRRSSALLHAPLANGAGNSISPEAHRTTPGKSANRRISIIPDDVIEETDEVTRKLIEQLRQEDLQTRGLRRRS